MTRGSETSSDTAIVHVETNVGNGLVTTVTNGASPLSGADVVVIDGAGTRYPGTTNASGVATLKGLPDGSYTVYVWRDGFLPQKVTATVTDGNGTVSIASCRARSRRRRSSTGDSRYDEIIAAGIDPNDPANQNVVHFTICLAFGNVSCVGSPQITGITNSAGQIFGGSVSGGGASGGGGGGGGGGGVPCTATQCAFTMPTAAPSSVRSR